MTGRTPTTPQRRPPSPRVPMKEPRSAVTGRVLAAGIRSDAPPADRMAAIRALDRLPPGVPPDLVRESWARLVSHPLTWHRLRKTPDAYLPTALEGLREAHHPAATFLTTALVGQPTVNEIREANAAFRNLDPDTPYTPGGRARIRKVMEDPRYLEATRVTVSRHGCREEALLFFRALLYEGSDTSAQVLLPFLRAAATRPEERDWFLKFAPLAASPAMKAAFDILSAP